MKNSKINISLTAQNRLIILGLILSTTLIIIIAFFAINHIQSKLNQGYKNFGQILSKTLAIESVEITKDIPEFDKYNTLRSHSMSILKSNEDIAFIEFANQQGETIYSSKEDYPKQALTSKIAVSSPLIVKTPTGATTVGSVMVGLSGSIINQISSTTRASLLFVFIVTWLLFSFVILLNTYLMARELKILHLGVRKISTGEFGYKVDGKGVSPEVKELFNSFNDMSNRLHIYEEQNVEQLTLERNKLEAVLMSIANGVVVCDNFDNVVLVNNHAKSLLEVEENEILETKIQQYCDTDGELCFKEKIEEFKNTPLDVMEKKPLEFNIEVDKRVIKSVISPMFSRHKEYVGYILVLIDVTKETEMEKLRGHFISNVSHELRTPVTVLRSYIDTLYNFGDSFDFNTQKDFIGVMNQEIIRLNKMVNEILDFSRLESSNVKIEKTLVDIPKLINVVTGAMQVLAQENELAFSVIVEPDLPEVVANRDSIERVLSNLVSNAIKYSTKGKRIKIRAERARVGEFLEVSVEDQGVGIAEKFQKKIFDRFFRIENETHTVKGTGLGLHLVKIAIEKHHQGQVFVQSKPGEGSTFGFRLPLNVTLEDIAKEEDYEHPPIVIENIVAETTAQNELSEQMEVQIETPSEIELSHESDVSSHSTPTEPELQHPANDGWEISLEKREVQD